MPETPARQATGRTAPAWRCEAVVVGVSAGGLDALKVLLAGLPAGFPAPVIIVQHRKPDTENLLPRLLAGCGPLVVSEAEDKVIPRPGNVYLAPADYHLLVETDGSLSLTVDEPERFARPSINALFDTAADRWGPALIAVVLTGANADGSLGVRRVKARGGRVIVQDPAEAAFPAMPLAAIAALAGSAAPAGGGFAAVRPPDRVARIGDIAGILTELVCGPGGRTATGGNSMDSDNSIADPENRREDQDVS